MNIKSILAVLFLIFTMSVYARSNEQDLKPNLISPGESGNTTVVELSTPTFSWTSVPWASEYRIVVFKSESGSLLSYEEIAGAETPVINKEIKGQATSWTPSSIQRMNTGSNYTWYVQAIDVNGTGTWSKGGSFRVEIPVVLTGIEENLREKLKEQGVTDETLDKVFNDLKNEIKEVVIIDKGKSTDSTKPIGVLGNEDTGSGDNVMYGSGAGASLVLTGGVDFEGQYNSFFGYLAGNNTTSGDNNAFSGNKAGYSNTTGIKNTFSGYGAGYLNIQGTNNTFSGYRAGLSSTGSYNTFSGSEAGYDNTHGSKNTFLGYQAGYNNSGSGDNTFSGYQAGYSNIFGDYNTFSGSNAGYSNTTGDYNTFSGGFAGRNNSTGSGNLFLGYSAGYDETGSNKLYIETDYDSRTTPLIYGEFDNNIVTINGKLGIGTTTPAFPLEIHTTGSNAKIVINRTDGAAGHFLVKTSFATFGTASNHPLRMNVNNIPKVFLLPNGNFGLGVTTPLHPLHLASGAYCSSSGVWQNASSRDFKENIVQIKAEEAFEALNNLDPVKYNYKKEKDELYAGFIAEDVPELVASKGRKSLGTMDIVAVLTKVVKEQQNTIEKLKKDQDRIINDLIKRIEKVENK